MLHAPVFPDPAGKTLSHSISPRGSFIFSILFIFSALMIPEAKGQDQQEDSLFCSKATQQLSNLYEKEMGSNTQLYNGKEYLRQGEKTRGFAFFETDTLTEGSVFYDGKLYSGIDLQYDLANQQVVISNYAKTGLIKLVNEKINYFIIQGHTFFHLNPGTEDASEGFYDRRSDGLAKIFVKREKRLLFSGTAGENQPVYSPLEKYFLQINNHFYKISGEKSLLLLLKDRREQLKKFGKENNIRFRRDPEDAMVKTAEYYNQIKN
jgi:hypothetical protein